MDSASQIEDGSWRESSVHAVISVEATAKSIMFPGRWQGKYKKTGSGVSSTSWAVWRGWYDSRCLGACKDSLCGVRCAGIQYLYG